MRGGLLAIVRDDANYGQQLTDIGNAYETIKMTDETKGPACKWGIANCKLLSEALKNENPMKEYMRLLNPSQAAAASSTSTATSGPSPSTNAREGSTRTKP